MLTQRLLESSRFSEALSRIVSGLYEHVAIVRAVVMRTVHARKPVTKPAFAFDPYRELGVSRLAHPIVIKQHYRRLVREIHPDRLRSMGVDAGVISKAEYALARINNAYDVIARAHGLK